MERDHPLDQYLTLSVIGQGSYAKVLLVRKKSTGQLYALKSMKKKYIEKKNQVRRVMTQKQILTQISHPFLVTIHASFQDHKKLYLVLEYCPGGELFGLLARRKRLRQDDARFYAAQVVLALEYLHSRDIIYRDLKPQNILICRDGYIKLTDFGLSRNNIQMDKEAMSVCGTPEYLAPEVVLKKGHGKPVDWWCLGALIYELVHGLPPFYTKNRAELFNRIKTQQPHISKTWSQELKDLFRQLFTKDPQIRINFALKIHDHPWFSSIDWSLLKEKQIKPSFLPVLKGDCDVSHFSTDFTGKSLESQSSSVGDCMKLEGFSYSGKAEVEPLEAKGMEEIESQEDDGVMFVEDNDPPQIIKMESQ